MRFTRLLLITAFLLSLPIAVQAQAQLSPDDLPAKYQRWLEEEVVYIITEVERESFLKLTDNELRDKFIENFWEIRDPTPGTRANEFRTEHYERIEHANKYFGNRSAKNGWRSDRGRYWILLGKPKQRSEFPNNTLVYPAELWFYQVPRGTTGGTSFFYLIFFRRSGAGDFILYHPALDGPESLTWKGRFDYNESEVYDALQRLDPELAQAAQGYDPMNPGNALASEVLIGLVDSIPENTIDDSWAEKFVDSKGEVVVNYSFVPLDLNVPLTVHTDMNGRQFVHYGFSLDPANIDAGQHEDRYYVVFEVIPSLANLDGTLIYEQTKTAEIAWTPDDFKSFSTKSLMVTDFFPTIPGEYTFTLRVRNKVSKKFYLHTQQVSIPNPRSDQFRLTPLTLHYKYEQDTEEPSKIKPFRFFTVAYSPSDLNLFASRENIYLFTELHFPTGDNGKRVIGEINFQFDIRKAGELVKRMTHIIPEDKVNNLGLVYMSRQLVLEDLELGTYTLEVTATEAKSGLVDKRSTNFTIEAPANIPRPNTFALRSKSNSNELEQAVTRAVQLKNAGLHETAAREFQQILATQPTHLEAAISYASMLYEDMDNPTAAMEVLRPVAREEPNNEELVFLLARCAMDTNDLKSAAGYYERLLFVDPNNLEAINASARIALELGNKERARERLKRSLKLNPDQPEVEAMLKSLD